MIFAISLPRLNAMAAAICAACIALLVAVVFAPDLAAASEPGQEPNRSTTQRMNPDIAVNAAEKLPPKDLELRTSSQAARIATRNATPDAASFRWPNEEFYFSVRFNGIEAMRAILRSGSIQYAGDRAYIPLSAYAKSVGFFQNIYPLHDRANTFIDPADYLPLRSEKHFEERGKTRIYKVDFLHDAFRAKVFKSRKTRSSRYNHAIPGQTHDMLSWLYDLRAREELKVGDEFAYYVYDGWKFSRVDMKVEAKEDVYTPMGWFKAWKISFIRQVMTAKRQRNDKKQPLPPELVMKTPNDHTGHVWLSRDENRLPIKVAIDSQFGTGVAVLIKYTPHHKTQVAERN
jgi:hypothetical protein